MFLKERSLQRVVVKKEEEKKVGVYSPAQTFVITEEFTKQGNKKCSQKERVVCCDQFIYTEIGVVCHDRFIYTEIGVVCCDWFIYTEI